MGEAGSRGLIRQGCGQLIIGTSRSIGYGASLSASQIIRTISGICQIPPITGGNIVEIRRRIAFRRQGIRQHTDIVFSVSLIPGLHMDDIRAAAYHGIHLFQPLTILGPGTGLIRCRDGGKFNLRLRIQAGPTGSHFFDFVLMAGRQISKAIGPARRVVQADLSAVGDTILVKLECSPLILKIRHSIALSIHPFFSKGDFHRVQLFIHQGHFRMGLGVIKSPHHGLGTRRPVNGSIITRNVQCGILGRLQQLPVIHFIAGTLMDRIIRLVRIIGSRLHTIGQLPDYILGYPIKILIGQIVLFADPQSIVGITRYQGPDNAVPVGHNIPAVFQTGGNGAVAQGRQIALRARVFQIEIGMPVQAVSRRAVHTDGFAVPGAARVDNHFAILLYRICLGRGQDDRHICRRLIAGRGRLFVQDVAAVRQALHHMGVSIADPLVLNRPRTVQQLQGGAGERTAGFIHFGYAYGSVSFCRPGSQAADGSQARNRQQEGQGKGQKSSGSGISAAGFCERMLKHLVPPWY